MSLYNLYWHLANVISLTQKLIICKRSQSSNTCSLSFSVHELHICNYCNTNLFVQKVYITLKIVNWNWKIVNKLTIKRFTATYIRNCLLPRSFKWHSFGYNFPDDKQRTLCVVSLATWSLRCQKKLVYFKYCKLLLVIVTVATNLAVSIPHKVIIIIIT